jgi:hypothetical protein
MGRKLTHLLSLLLVTFISLPAMAQLDELNLKTVSISETSAESVTPDTQWYLVYNKRSYSFAGGYWRDTKGESICYMSDGIGTDIITEGDFASQKADILVRFLSTEKEGQYKIQFGTGNYMKSDLWTSSRTSDAANFYVYNISTEELGHYGINVVGADDAYGDRVDNNGGGASLAPWDSGILTTTGGNNDWSLFAVTLTEVEERALLEQKMNDCLKKYESYVYGEDTLSLGTGIMQYDITQEEYEAWKGHIQTIYLIYEGEQEATDEQIKEEIAAVEDGWTYIKSKQVPFTVTPGNYRIVSAMSWTNSKTTVTGKDETTGEDITETVTTHPTKAMFATLDTRLAKWADLDETDCRYLWKITTASDSTYVIQNIATDDILDTCITSSKATLEKESDTKWSFQYIKTNDAGKYVIAFHPNSAKTTDDYMHCGGHGSGAGVSGDIVGWYASADATQWYLEPVDDATVAQLIEDYAPYKNHELLVYNYQQLQAKADSAIAIAKDEQYITTTGTGLITSSSQMSSPFTCSEEEEGGNGYKFDFVLDGKTDTYWHSTWSGGNLAGHSHWFQVSLNEPIDDAANLVAYIYRRTSAANDHITEMSVYGANASSALDDETEESWTLIGSITTPWTSGQTEVTSSVLKSNGTYSYLRFYIDNTAGSDISSTRGYAHMAEFQLYPVTIDGNTQYSQMGEVRTNLEAALAVADSIDTDELTMDDYNALKTAVDAFVAAVVDPLALATAIANNKDASDLVVIGSNPGQWPEGTEASSLPTIISQAKAYLKAGAYTKDAIDRYTESIESAAANIMNSANKVEEGKWYRLRFDSEENYTKYNWGTGNVVNETLGDLYETVLAPANVITDDDKSSLEGFNSLEYVMEGQDLRFLNGDDVESVDQTAFRFMAQGDTAYVIQHKSGLFINANGRGNTLQLSLTPGLFDVKPVGLGKVAIHERNLDGSECFDEPVYLHAQNAGHALVTWNADSRSSNSALLIEPVSDFDEGEDVAEGVYRYVLPNSMLIWCYPTQYNVTDGNLYRYAGASIDEENNEISLAFQNASDGIEAGVPALYIYGDTAQFDKDADKEQEKITGIGTSNFAPVPSTEIPGITGTYAYQWIDAGTNVVVAGGEFGKEGNHFEVASGEDATDCTRDVFANTGYITPSENIIETFSPERYDLVITVSGDGFVNAIEKVNQTFKAAANIYSVDGTLLKKNGTMNDVKAMGRGIYIIGGVKVIIK